MEYKNEELVPEVLFVPSITPSAVTSYYTNWPKEWLSKSLNNLNQNVLFMIEIQNAPITAVPV